MLRRLPGWKFLEWKYYEELEPFPAERADWNAAHIVQLLARGGKQLREYMLPFGDYQVVMHTQSIEFQEMLIDGWISGNNAAQKGNRGS